VTITAVDTTLDSFYDPARGTLSSLSDGGFQLLLSGARANTGAIGRRYLFEVLLLESVPAVENVLRIGFSTEGSSLFLGDGTSNNFGFDSDGFFIAAGQRKKACSSMGKKVVGVLLNLDKDSPNANTVSLFLDGVRACKPLAIPADLCGKALFPTITFKNVTLVVNFGNASRQLQPLPFRCTMFADILKADCKQSTVKPAKDGSFQAIVPVGLPEQGVFDFVAFLQSSKTHFEELSARRLLRWCKDSGLDVGSASASNRDRPDFSGIDGIDESMQSALLRLALLARRDIVICEVGACLLKTGRDEILAKLPASAKKVAVVVLGEPSAPFKAWVQQQTKDADTSKWYLPRLKGEGPDVSDKALSCYSQFCLPTEADGFAAVQFEWAGKQGAEEHLKAWIKERKASTVIEDLKPGEWFTTKLQEWHKLREELKKRHTEYAKKKKESPDMLDIASAFDIKSAAVEDIHNIDSKDTPLYANFKWEDWILLTWRYQLHLLAHAFATDVADPDRPGIPEEQLPHYYNIYYKAKCDPTQIGCADFPKAFKLLKLAGLELKSKILSSSLDKEMPVKDFIVGIEQYRRDRIRRIDAGDESAQLRFPKAGPPKGAPAKAQPGKASAPGAPKPPAPHSAKPGVAAAAGAGAVKRPMPPNMPPGAAAGGAVKRPAPPSAPPPGVAKKPRVEEPPPAVAKTPMAKTPVAKVGVAKAPVAKVGVAKTPVGKAPVAKVAVAKTPAA
jgi:hypothetical protein